VSKIIFKEDTHEYFIDGEKLPSVTSILEAVGITDFSQVPDGLLLPAIEFGQAIHKATELDDLGNLDEDTLDDKLRPYLNAWRSFKKEYNVRVKYVERKVYSKKYRYCGRIDKVAYVGDWLSVIDIKSSSQLHKATAIQTAGYKQAYNEEATKQIIRRYAVLLKEDGTYKVEEYKDPSDINVFLSALTLYNYIRR